MSKENAIRFMTILGRDKDLKSRHDSVLDKYDTRSLTKEEWDNVIRNEVIPFANAEGFDFSAEDFKSQQCMVDKELSDDQLAQVAGGIEMRYSCTIVQSPEFQTRFNSYNSDNGCKFYVAWIGRPKYATTGAQCIFCDHLNIDV